MHLLSSFDTTSIHIMSNKKSKRICLFIFALCKGLDVKRLDPSIIYFLNRLYHRFLRLISAAGFRDFQPL
jgi:hypothetical protein